MKNLHVFLVVIVIVAVALFSRLFLLQSGFEHHHAWLRLSARGCRGLYDRLRASNTRAEYQLCS